MKDVIKQEKMQIINSLGSLLAVVLLVVALGDALFKDLICLGTILLLIANAIANAVLFVGSVVKYRRDRNANTTDMPGKW
jgi:hypothetical protein